MKRTVAARATTFAGWFLAVCALVYNPLTMAAAVRVVSTVFHRPWMEAPDAGHVLRMEAYFAVAAALLLLWARSLRRRPRARGDAVIVVLLVVCVPLFTLEVALRPFADRLDKSTSLFVSDPELGWKLRLSTVQPWGNITVTTNARGLRGPEVAYERRADTPRILYLGDSVTFGYNVERWQDTYPFVLGRALGEVETVNAGVGGYSPWQEAAFLRGEGMRYAPHAVVVGFVLNDVFEKFTLVRFGGYGTGHQMAESYYSRLDHVLSRSGLWYHVRWVANRVASKRLHKRDARIHSVHYGPLDVQSLIKNPDAPYLKGAWEITYENLDAIFDTCTEHHIPALLVIFPFAQQLDAPDSTNTVQQRILEHARRNGIDCVDLLPGLAAYEKAHNVTTKDLFLDLDHLTVAGHKAVAECLTPRVEHLIGN